jgi:hypothetical protein
MTEPLQILIEHSVQIARDYLERTGELGDTAVASHFLAYDIELMVRRGERRRLLLSNKAIDDYRRFRRKRASVVAREGAPVGRP